MSQQLQTALGQVVSGESLSQEESSRLFQIMMNGGATAAQMAAFITALRMKGETADEIAGAAHTMRSKALPFNAPANAIDTCGTGGDGKAGQGSFNISTTVAIIVAACGVPVVKHGNRAVSSQSGSADILQHLGIDITASVETMQRALEKTNLCFLMAPNYHQAMKHIAPVRQELKLRTIFNLLGPLSNPAQVDYQLIGVYDKSLLRPFADVLNLLNVKCAWVVHGADGMDEISLTAETFVAQLKDGEVTEFTITPEQYGLSRCLTKDLQGGDVETNAIALRKLLRGEPSPYRDIVLLNSAAALLIVGEVASIEEGITRAAKAIDADKGAMLLQQLVAITNEADGE